MLVQNFIRRDPLPAYDLKVKATDLEIYVKFCVKVFKIS